MQRSNEYCLSIFQCKKLQSRLVAILGLLIFTHCRSIDRPSSSIKVVGGESPETANPLTQSTVLLVERGFEPSLGGEKYSWRPQCTGVLVAKDLVLTAGHCLNLIQRKSLATHAIFFGTDASKLKSWKEGKQDPNDRVAAILDFQIYPRFIQGQTSPSYDLGWIRLDLSKIGDRLPKVEDGLFASGTRYQPIAIMPQQVDKHIIGSDKSIVFGGFGYSVVGASAEDSVKGKLQIGYAVSLERMANPIIPNLINISHDAAAPCFGDSGGPLAVSRAGQLQLIGLTQGKDKSLHPELYGVIVADDSAKQKLCLSSAYTHTAYTEVFPYMDWIQESSGNSLLSLPPPVAQVGAFDANTSLQDWCEKAKFPSSEQQIINLLAAAYVNEDGRNLDVSQDSNYSVYKDCQNFADKITSLRSFMYKPDSTSSINKKFPEFPVNLHIFAQLPQLKEIDIDSFGLGIQALPQEFLQLRMLHLRLESAANILVPHMPNLESLYLTVKRQDEKIDVSSRWDFSQMQAETAKKLKRLTLEGGTLDLEAIKPFKDSLLTLRLWGVNTATTKEELRQLFPNLEVLEFWYNEP